MKSVFTSSLITVDQFNAIIKKGEIDENIIVD